MEDTLPEAIFQKMKTASAAKDYEEFIKEMGKLTAVFVRRMNSRRRLVGSSMYPTEQEREAEVTRLCKNIALTKMGLELIKLQRGCSGPNYRQEEWNKLVGELQDYTMRKCLIETIHGGHVTGGNIPEDEDSI